MHACMHACMHTYVYTYIHTYIHTYVFLFREVRFLGRKNTKQTQRRGRNIWYGWFN